MAIERVGVAGCGLMGGGIAQQFAVSGFTVQVLEANEDLLRRGIARIESRLAREVAKGVIGDSRRREILERITGVVSTAALSRCELVVEAVVEDRVVKRELFAALDRILEPEAILATNTSSLSVIDLAAATGRRERVAGMHFFNPVPVMPLVEIVRTLASSAQTIETLREVARRLGKTAVLAKDTPGFIVNRLLIPYLLDAISMLEQGVADRDDIDAGMKLGCGVPMGPLTLCDFIGLETLLAIADVLYAEYRQQRFAAPPLLRRMVAAGTYGRKSGEGFYHYALPG